MGTAHGTGSSPARRRAAKAKNAELRNEARARREADGPAPGEDFVDAEFREIEDVAPIKGPK